MANTAAGDARRNHGEEWSTGVNFLLLAGGVIILLIIFAKEVN
jgi:hypothetical protein